MTKETRQDPSARGAATAACLSLDIAAEQRLWFEADPGMLAASDNSAAVVLRFLALWTPPR